MLAQIFLAVLAKESTDILETSIINPVWCLLPINKATNIKVIMEKNFLQDTC
jgi:hypothetical protein